MKTKEKILEILEQNKGCFVSSRILTEKINVSRNAIWKAVNDLRDSGYEIDSVTNKGYMLLKTSDIISLQGIESYLIDKEKINMVAVFDELQSTNMTAKIDAISGVLNKKVIIAKHQTAGVAHGKQNYDSPMGGVYISIIKDPPKDKKQIKASDIGKAVADVIESQIDAKISLDQKNNRIYLNGEKICGIMTEYIADLETGDISTYVIGIGIQLPGILKNRLIAALIDRLL
jgi:BirA family biotin operon repressor/biotin-[acetyl-CoA-carboxylase] ligase